MRSLRSLRILLGAAALVVASMAPGASRALPFQYADGDIIGVFTKSGVDMIVNLGQLPASGATTKVFALPSQFSGTTAGGKFSAFRVGDPFAFPESIEFTTQNALSFPDPTGQFASAVGAAQANLISWFSLLPLIPDAPAGGNVFARDTDRVVVNANATFSYSTVLGISADAIGEVLTNGVSTKTIFDGNGDLAVPFYTVTYDFDNDGNSVYGKTLRGTFTVDDGAVTFTAIPEPGTLVLVFAGLTGLALSGRRERA